MSSGNGNGYGSNNGTLMNENSSTILFVISCVSGIVEAIRLLLGVCRIYCVDGVSTWKTEWELSCIRISIVTSFRYNSYFIGIVNCYYSKNC